MFSVKLFTSYLSILAKLRGYTFTLPLLLGNDHPGTALAAFNAECKSTQLQGPYGDVQKLTSSCGLYKDL